LQLTPNNKGANGVDQQKHRYLSLGIEIGNEPEERSRIKVIASLSEQCSVLLVSVDVVVGLLRLHLGTHRGSIWKLWKERIYLVISVM
jgi:hypothetical protein